MESLVLLGQTGCFGLEKTTCCLGGLKKKGKRSKMTGVAGQEPSDGKGENETNRETEAETETDTSLSLEENSRETDSSPDTLPLSLKYPSLPSWEVQVTNDSGEFETMLVPRSEHVPYVPWTGGPAEADFVEECYSLIESMKNWILSSSQLSFVRQNELSHEIGLLNKVESQASTIKTLDVFVVWDLVMLEDQVIPLLIQLVV
ncbi:hypothetical protein ACJW31_09G152300 [Castanea mollissima]